jgi:hypothetical protein
VKWNGRAACKFGDAVDEGACAQAGQHQRGGASATTTVVAFDLVGAQNGMGEGGHGELLVS